jgi:ParB family chromosome partitioning protein
MEQLARRVVARELSVRQVEALVRREKDAAQNEGAAGNEASAGAVEQSASARDLANRLTRSLGARVNVVEAGPGHGRLEIHYASLDQLDGLLKRLLG